MNEQHTVPVIERMMALLAQLETAGRGLRIGELVAVCGGSRSTVYRILNTLGRHHMIHRDEDGRYRLGSRILQLAARMPGDPRWIQVVQAATPRLRNLGLELGDTSKVSVLDGGEALCIAGVQGPRPFALSLTIGARYPLHAGAASKVLLAAQAPAARARLVEGGLAALTVRTVTDLAALERELRLVRAQGWAEDRGEYELSVAAYAAPIRSGEETIAALSMAFLADADARRRERMREAVVEAARQVSADLAVTIERRATR